MKHMMAGYVQHGAFPAKGYEVADGEEFPRGAVLSLAAGVLELADDAAPADIIGVAANASQSAPGFGVANNPTVSTAVKDVVTVLLATSDASFWARLTDNSNDSVTPTAADIGVEYGVTKQASGEWTVDKNKSDAVIITGIDLERNGVYFQFLESVRAI